ncbi:MAG: ferritin-like domain-containing protein [Acidiferrobacter sp.]
MLANTRVAGYLSQALCHEMSVVQQYLTQAGLCELWGMTEHAAYFRRESGEELKHAGRLIHRMLGFGLVPNATRLAPVRPGRDLREMLVLDRLLEWDAVRLYDEAGRHATRFRDHASSELFGALLADEQAHVGELERMLVELEAEEKCHG